MVFNMKKSASCGTNERHHLDWEPPLPIYIGLNIHQQTSYRVKVKLPGKWMDFLRDSKQNCSLS